MDFLEIDLFDPVFDIGDDERCPMCGAPLGKPNGWTRDEGVVTLTYHCRRCGSDVYADYWAARITAERSM